MAQTSTSTQTPTSTQTQGRVATPTPTPTPTALTGGASALQETYQDWQVSCRVVDGAKRCALSQQQVQPNGQRVVAVELQKGSGDALAGTLVLPFGLLLDPGITIAVDDRPAGKPLRFQTCLPAGCLVPLAFDTALLTNLRAGTTAKIQTSGVDGAAVPFALALKGFAAALDRLDALMKP